MLKNKEKTMIIDALRSKYSLSELLEKMNISKSSYCYQYKCLYSTDKYEPIKQKFIEISTRQASFNNMSNDEKLAKIANLIEHLLKKNDKFISLDYSQICFEYISDETITSYRKKIQCFRHAHDKALSERNCYTEEQKKFFIDYGLAIINVIHSLTLEK